MTNKIGAWERKALLYLVDTTYDVDAVYLLLEKLEKENNLIQITENLWDIQIEFARSNLASPEGKKFILMFVWDFDNQIYLPFTSKLFNEEDTDYLKETVANLIKASVELCSDGFELRTINEKNKLLAFTIQVLCENNTMQINLDYYRKKFGEDNG